ncbi:MAG: phosphonate C-P lyase system protein PhnH [Pseudomonadota bacterium]
MGDVREASVLEGGFSDPATQGARAFRALLDAMAHPGRVFSLEGARAPGPLSNAAASALLTLCDPDTPLFLAPSHDAHDLRAWIEFHTGAPMVPAAKAMFALGTWDSLDPLSAYPIGTPEYPDRSTTLIVECESLTQGCPARFTGPGIESSLQGHLPALAPLQQNNSLFPLGVDWLFTCGSDVMALPRSTKIEAL